VLSDSACQADLIALRSFSRSLVVLRLQKMENARQLISDVVSEIYSLLEQHSHDEIVVFVSGHGRHNGPTCFDQTYLRVGSDWLDVYDIIAPIAEIEDDDCYLKFSFGFFIEPCSVPFPSPAPRRMFPGLSPFEFPNDENCFVYRFISTVGNESSLRDSSHDERIDGGHIPMCTLAKFMARWDEDVCDAFELVQQSFYWSENLLRARTLNPMSMSGNRLHFVGTGPRSAILRKKKSRPTTTLSTHCTLLLERPLMRYLKESQAEEQKNYGILFPLPGPFLVLLGTSRYFPVLPGASPHFPALSGIFQHFQRVELNILV